MNHSKFANKVLRKAAKFLGRLHARGIIHAHLHGRNILADRYGNVAFVDLKALRRSQSHALRSMDRGRIYELANELEGKGTSIDFPSLKRAYKAALAGRA